MKPKVIVITGATASSKTQIAIDLAHKIDAEIICADSRIIYRDFDIVSAKPTIEERQNIVHHLIDIISPLKDFSAGDFAHHAQKILENTKKNIIVTGGTWFYIKALLGCEALIDCEIDLEYREELNKLSSDTLWGELHKFDPKRAELIHPNNKDKIIRSLELIKALNMPLSDYKRENNRDWGAVWYRTDFEREVLYQRINKRVDNMMDLGLYDEWKKNCEKYPESKVLINTIGYAEFFENEDINSAVDKIKQHTRNFAKRQMTYFNSRDDIKIINSADEILNDLAL